MSFWKRLKTEIDKENTTFRWVAEQLKVPESTVSRWRTSGALPKADQAVTIAKLFNISVEYLVTGEDSKIPAMRDNEREILKILNEVSDNELKVLCSMIKAYAGEKEIDLSTQTAG